MKGPLRTMVACAIVVLTGATGLPAQEAPAAEAEHQGRVGHESHKNSIGVFVGITTGGEEDGAGEEDATGTIGLEYERRLSRRLGIGGVAEFAGGERRDHVGIIALSLRASRQAKFVVGAGWERASGERVFGGETEPLARVGFMYEFEVVPGNHVSPGLNVDFVDGVTLVVVGATIGWGF